MYGSNTGGAYSTTVYAGSGNGHGGEGNSHGFIGQGDNSGDGQIGGARSLRCDMWTMGSVVALFALAFAVMIGL